MCSCHFRASDAPCAGGGAGRWQVLLDGIVKRYRIGRGHPPLRAVDGVWLGIGRSECFGLLGAFFQGSV